ncbi:aspartyl protease family protein [Brevundimonas vesicularis]|uniref:aspartyl protease family protein n=1 Tax=Brevundimonas vesicularis TaxID=41276 RepID=UPI0038D40CEB
MRRRTFLLRAAGLAAAVGGGLWLKDNLLWKRPKLSFGPGGSSWLPFASRRATVPTVQIKIGGRAVTALVDTGAQYSVIDRDLVTELGLGQGFDMPLVAYGVGGQPQAGRGVTLDLTVGQLHVPQLRTAILDLGPLATEAGLGAQVVLGQDLFNAAILELDMERQRLRLVDPETWIPTAGHQPVEVSRKGTALTTEVSLEGAVIEAVIDTGFSALIALSEGTATTAGLLDGREERSGASIVLGGVARARMIQAQTMTFDQALWREVQVHVFADSPLPNYPQALLGMAAFAGRQVALDLGRGRLYQSGELDLTVG